MEADLKSLGHFLRKNLKIFNQFISIHNIEK